MGAIIGWSLRFRLLVVALAAGVLAFGFAQLRDAPVDVLPEFTPPYAEIQTEALGLSATEVENLITVPLEADLLNGVEGVEVIRSESLPGLSSVVLVFAPGTDVYRARQLVQERLAHAHVLPRVSKPPTLLQPLSSSSRVMMIALASDRVPAIERSVIARWTVRPRLMGVPGVANVAVWGMRDQQLQVQVDPERLRDRDVTLAQIVKTAGNAQVVSPLTFLEASTPGSGGFIETPQQRLQVRNVLERLADPEQLGRVPVEETGGRLRLSDVADIKVDHQPLIGDAVVHDGEGLLLVIEKLPGADTLEVTRGVEAALETLRPGLTGIRTDTSVFRPATFVEEAIDNLTIALALGAVLAALGLLALLGRRRDVLIALAAFAVSLVAAALVLHLLGVSFNAISFAGLAAAVAVVVDDAVVGAVTPARRAEAVRRPLVYGTLIALLAVVPVAIMEGRPGAFFEPLALAYALAVLAATGVAVTVTPALRALLGEGAGREPAVLRRLRTFYAAALARFMRDARVAPAAAGVLLVAGLAVLPLLASSPVPSFQERDVLVRLDGEPGTSRPRMAELTAAVSRELRALPGIEGVGAHVGRAVTGDRAVDVSSSELWAAIAAGADRDGTVRLIEDTVARVADVEHDVATYSERRIRDIGALDDGDDEHGGGLGALAGSGQPLAARVYGQDLAVLDREAERVRRVMAGVEGVVAPRIERPKTQPTVVIEVDLDRARRLGIKPGDVRRAQATLFQGIQVGSVFEGQKVFDVIVVGVPATRRGVADVRSLLLDRPGGGHVRLGEVADVRLEDDPVAIEREAVSRYVDVEAGVEGRSLGAVAGDVRDRVAELSFPLEYHAEVLEESTADELGAGRALVVALVAALAAFLLLQAAFRSWRLAALGVVLLPAALAGGLLATLVAGGELSLGSLVGLLALLGLAARTVAASVRHLEEHGSAQDRLAPIVTTAVTLALLLLPLAVLGARPGLEVVHPMAVTLLGGLVTCTFAGLFVLPALYGRLGGAPQAPDDWEGALGTQFEGVKPVERELR